MAIYACSDIHGQKKAYDEAVALLAPGDELYIVGDAIDRGPDSMDILLDIVARDNVHLIMGNHEYMMANALNDVERDVWRMPCNGGKETEADFLKRDIDDQNIVKDLLTKNMPVQVILNINNTEFALVHASPFKNYCLDRSKDLSTKIAENFYTIDKRELAHTIPGTIYSAVWCSMFRQEMSYHIEPQRYFNHFSTCFVVGHVPIQRIGYEHPAFVGNVLNIDGGPALAEYTPVEDRDKLGLFVINLSELSSHVYTLESGIVTCADEDVVKCTTKIFI